MSDVTPPPGSPEPVVSSDPVEVPLPLPVVAPMPQPVVAPMPPPAPPGYAAPPAFSVPPPGVGYYRGPDNTMGTLALVMGILGVCCVLPVLGGILGIVFGRMGMTKASKGLATNGGAAKAGFILGIISLALAAIGLVFYILFFVILIAASSTTGTLT